MILYAFSIRNISENFDESKDMKKIYKTVSLFKVKKIQTHSSYALNSTILAFFTIDMSSAPTCRARNIMPPHHHHSLLACTSVQNKRIDIK